MEVEAFPDKLFNKTCRTCMCKEEADGSQVLISILEYPKESPAVLIVDLISSATPQLTINASDELPKEICSHCLKQVLNVYQFQQMCIRSDTHMRSLLEYGTVEDKFLQTPEISASLDLPTEDPLRSAVEDPVEVKDYDAEMKSCLKLELKENESELDNFVFEDSIHNENDKFEKLDKADHEAKEKIDTLTTQLDSADSKTEESAENTDSDWEAENGKSTIKKLKTKKARSPKMQEDQNADNILELPNPKNKRRSTLPCPECGKIFDRSYSLNRHLNVHKTNGKPYECSKCKYRFTTKAHLTRHELNHETEVKSEAISTAANNPEGYKCPECPRRFAKRESLSAHRQYHRKTDDGSEDSIKTFECTLCPKKFKKLNLLTRHSRNHEENKHFKCHLCDKTFGLNAHLVDHLNKHNGIKPFVCKFCNKAFQQSCTLKDHIRTHTGEQPFLCSECGKAFNSSSNMKQHLLRHTGEKRYECPECPKKFPCLSDLASHMAVHKKVKPHVCDICGAAFGKPYQLKKHKMYHNGEKPHKCEYCEMRFVCADHMRRHMRTHTGEKPYKCKYCTRAFAQSNDLVKHLRSHVGDNVYKCELCPKAFRLATELREHFSEHKNDDEATRAKYALELKEETEKEDMNTGLADNMNAANSEPVENTNTVDLGIV